MGDWMRDLKHAVRTLRRSPGFTLAAVGTLALALGVNAGIFSVVDAVLLRPLPYPEADRLVYIVGSAPGSDLPEEFPLSMEFLLHYQEHSTQLEDVGSFNGFTGTIRAGDRVERLRQSMPSMSTFSTLGVSPLLGRLAREEEDGQVVLISHGLWTTWFGADPGVLGQVHEFAAGPAEIIGVMPPDFNFPAEGVDAWIPRHFRGEELTPGQFGSMMLVGRLAEGADEASLRSELATLASRLPEVYGGSAAYARIIEQHVPVVRPLREQVVGSVATALQVLMGAVAVVLLIACANVASLFTVRAEGRGRDLAVRKAIGAGRGDLIRSEISEAVVVALAAGVLAMGLAWITLPLFLRVVPEGLPRISEIGLGWGTLLFTLAAAGVAGIACGLAPAVRSSAPELDRLKDGARGSTRRRHWGRDAMVVVQTALALTLLVASGLLLRSFQQLRDVDPGYDTEGLVTFQFAADQDHLTDGPAWADFHLAFLDRLRALPGVEAAGIIENMPLDEGRGLVGFATDAGGGGDPEAGPRANVTFAGGDYFGAAGIAVRQGRAFTDDDARVPGNVVLSQAAADLLWPDGNAVGGRLRNNRIEAWHTVVGVVEDIRQYDFREGPEPVVYYPLVGPEPRSWAMSSPGYLIRTDRGEQIIPEVRALVREVAPEAPMYRVFTIEQLVERSMVDLSFTMLTLGVAAALALLLGGVGLYGVLSYVVAERTQEIGVRMALGAEAARVRGMVVGQGVRVVAVGIVLGLLVALASTRALSSLLFGVAPVDPWTFGGMSLAMLAVGALASWIPATRAARVDPMTAMRG